MRSPPRPHRLRILLGRLASIVRWRTAWAIIGAAIIGLSVATPDLDRMQQVARERYGVAAADSVAAWRRMLTDAKAVDEQERLGRVNTFINRTTAFEDDSVVWNQPDYWATPLETLAKKAGDCEDFAIAKYVSLRLLDVPAEKLRLIYVRASIGAPGSGVSQAHMVLGYYPSPDAEPLILDNLIGDIRPAARRPDLFPVFSFNDQGLWVGGSSSSSADPTTRLSRWRSVLERMRQEGLQ